MSKYSNKEKIVYLVKNFEFMMTLLSITATYFLTTGIQFWISDYWHVVLGEPKEKTNLYFSICAITGPVAGVAVGGIAFARLGGFESYKSFPIAVGIMSLGAIVASPMPFFDNIGIAAFLLWFQFFCGGFCVPLLMSKLIHSVPPSASTTANSFANFVQNLAGYLPAPFVYGLIQDHTGGLKSRWGLFSLECSGIFAILILNIMLYRHCKETRAQLKKPIRPLNFMIGQDKSE